MGDNFLEHHLDWFNPSLPHIPLATRPDGGPVWSCGENYQFLAKDWVKGF